MFDSATVYDNTPLLSRQFITTTYRSRFRCCTPKVFFKTLRGCIAEFLFMTILTFSSVMIMQNAGDNPSESCLMVAIGHGFLYAVVVSISMQLSGGFLNPAVTIGVAFAGILTPITTLCYLLMQIIGAVTGAAIGSLYSEGAVNLSVQHLNHLPGKDEIDASTVMIAIFYEFLAASLLVMAVLTTAVDKASKLKNASPVILGFSVAVGVLATRDFTGGSINPARSLGPAVVGTADNRWDYHYVHWVGPLVGGVISSVVYRLFFSSKSWIPVFRHHGDDDDDDEVVAPIN